MAGSINTGGNIAVFNPADNPLVKYNFLLRVEGVYDIPCQRVQSFTREMEYEYIQEGGLNDYVHMIRKPVSRPFTFSIECHAGIHYVDPLPVGTELILPVMLFVTRYPGYFNTTAPERLFTFTGCVVTKRTYGELSANESGLVTDTIEFAYREFLMVDLPFDAGSADAAYNGSQSKPPNRSADSKSGKISYVGKNTQGDYKTPSVVYAPDSSRSPQTRPSADAAFVGRDKRAEYRSPSAVFAPESNRSRPAGPDEN